MGVGWRAAVIGIASGWTFGNTGPVARPIADDLDVSLAATGWLMTLLLIAHAASQLPAAAPIERYGAFAVVRTGLLALAVVNALLALAPGFAALLVLRFVAGLCTGPAFVANLQGFRRLGGPVAAGWFGGAATLGIAFAILAGGAIKDAGLDWRLQFWVPAALCLVAVATVPAYRDDAGPARPAGIREVIGNLAIWRIALLHTATFGSSLVVGAWIVVYIVDGGASGTVAGLIGFAMLGIAAFTRPWSGSLLGRGVGWVRVGVGGALLSAVGLAALAVSASPWLAIPAAVLGGIGLSLPFAPAFAGAATVEPERTAAATAFVNLSGSVFALAAIPLAGLDVEDGSGGGLTWALLAALAVGAAALNRRAPVRPG